MSNRGIESSITSVNIRSINFSWSSTLNFAFNKNKLLSYSAVDPRADNASGRLGLTKYQIGYPIQPLFSYAYAGLNAFGNPQIRLADGSITSTLYTESKDDLIYEGSTIPSYTGGLGNQFRYKAFNLSVNMIFNLGNVMRADVNNFYTGRTSQLSGFTGNLTTDFLNRWKVPGDELKTDIPVYIPGYESYDRNFEFYTKADINVLNASYAKIRDITLSYNLPQQVLEKLKVKSASIGIQATNFMVWKANDRGIDPEFQDLTAGARTLPPYKHAYSLSVNFTF